MCVLKVFNIFHSAILLKERTHMKELGVDRRIMLRLIEVFDE
jgi:hypothetical protein